MNIRRTRTTLWLTTLALTAGAAAMVAAHLAYPPAVDNADTGRGAEQPGPTTSSTQAAASAPNAAELRRVASRDLRQRLFDPPKVEVKPPPPKPLPPVQLISTILRVEGAASAWVRDGQATRKVTVNDTIGPDDNPATVTAIEADRLVLDHKGREVEVVRQNGGGSGGRR